MLLNKKIFSLDLGVGDKVLISDSWLKSFVPGSGFAKLISEVDAYNPFVVNLPWIGIDDTVK